MYAPDNNVPKPEIPPCPTLGRTTQNCVSFFSKYSLLSCILAVTTTPSRLSLSSIVLTTPTSTFLILIFVFPASIPSPVLK